MSIFSRGPKKLSPGHYSHLAKMSPLATSRGSAFQGGYRSTIRPGATGHNTPPPRATSDFGARGGKPLAVRNGMTEDRPGGPAYNFPKPSTSAPPTEGAKNRAALEQGGKATYNNIRSSVPGGKLMPKAQAAGAVGKPHGYIPPRAKITSIRPSGRGVAVSGTWR